MSTAAADLGRCFSAVLQAYNLIQVPSQEQAASLARGSAGKENPLRIGCALREFAIPSMKKKSGGAPLSRGCLFASLCLLLLITLSLKMRAEAMPPASHFETGSFASETIAPDGLPVTKADHPTPSRKLIVIGFMGGNVSASNLVHREALLIQALQVGYPHNIHAAIFANRNGDVALRTILQLLDEDGDGSLSGAEKTGARIVIFGHSWGASETITLANRLNQLSIPVLLTVQVDSVQKQSQNDGRIPPNVQEAINFYQSEGLLRGRSAIVAADPNKTTVLGNYESSYRRNPVSCAGYPWYARAFMKRHIQIENDPVLWARIEALIVAKVP
jgi:pimeloyl-ACP methyl ester carboxylesterase